MKTHKIIFWTTTTIIFIMEGVMPAFFAGSEESKQGMSHLGYPEYFGYALAVFKVLGSLALIIPQVPKRIKEWAYAGFIFDFLFASISYFCVDGPGFFAFFPLIFLGILALSYNSYLKLNP